MSSDDLTVPPDLTRKHQTGPVRTERPVYVSLLPPCNHACPAGENIQKWLSFVQEGDFYRAWQEIMRDNPFPAVHGRVCYHPCETDCNRANLDGAVSIHAAERFLGDRAIEEGWQPEITNEPSGRRVLIVGGGPSGLSAAYHLRRLGHEVEIRDAGPLAGGMMHFGIPAYRLPRDILEAEVRRIERMGVTIVLNHHVTDVLAEKKQGQFDAVFLAIGAHLSRRVEIPARDAGRMLDAVSFLKDVEQRTPPKLGRRVAVYGGGNTAMDAARVAVRMGSEPLIIYRRDRDHMPAHAFEADEALEEGVKIHWLRTIKSIDQTRFTVEIMELDENGRPRGTGQYETVEADDLIMALGQETDTSFLKNVPGIELQPDGTVTVDRQMQTGHSGIFAGGDMVPAERTVTTAVGHGKHAARCIDAFLRETTYEHPPRPEIATFDKLNLWFFTSIEQRPQSREDLKQRRTSFVEVVHGFEEQDAVFEAKRCFSCGNCFECDGCYGSCPEDAIERLGPGQGYRIKLEACTGCKICVQQCPCHAMEMVPEPATDT
jgi:NADPH-dependent glutamate synthase beta subunit-like oxidoreductase